MLHLPAATVLFLSTVQSAGIAALQPAATPAPAPASALPAEPVRLMIGEAAPALDAEALKWIKGEPVAGPYEPGRVYIIEFGATWCAACTQAIPTLAALQSSFGSRGLTVVSIASQEMSPGEVEPFVSRQGDRINYRVAFDESGATHDRWMAATWQAGIPAAFIVDQKGRIAWIGHPLEGLDAAVRQVVEGTYDLPAAAAAWKIRAELLERAAPILRRFDEHSVDGDHELAIAAADELLALSPAEFGDYAWRKFQIIALGVKDEPAAYRWADQAITGIIRDQPAALAGLASAIAEDSRLATRDLAIATRAAARADELARGSRPDALLVLARIAAEKGDWSAAVEHQTRAVSASPEADRKSLQARLDEYRAKAAKR